MPHPFDATLKELVQAHPAYWVALLGGTVTEPVEVLTPGPVHRIGLRGCACCACPAASCI